MCVCGGGGGLEPMSPHPDEYIIHVLMNLSNALCIHLIIGKKHQSLHPLHLQGLLGYSRDSEQGNDLLSSPVWGKCWASAISQIYPQGIYHNCKEGGIDHWMVPAV